jgi:DHA1 family bicyclomycin/chloramphenicol resistance-like MFS transporter
MLAVIPVTAGFLIFGSISMAILVFAQKYKEKHEDKQTQSKVSDPA